MVLLLLGRDVYNISYYIFKFTKKSLTLQINMCMVL